MTKEAFSNDDFANKSLFEISIPGSHHTTITDVDSPYKSFCICQNHDLLSQLYAGIRYLDLRVTYDKQKMIFIFHILILVHYQFQIYFNYYKILL